MKTIRGAVVALAVVLLAGPAMAKKCPADSVPVGHVCIDKYEASAWETSDAATIKNIQKGKIAAVAQLSLATQRGASSDDYGAACPDTGNGCKAVYAVSVVGVTPSRYATWFQAAAACRNAGKRLATNQEWQVAALGTPDPGTDNGTSDCAVLSFSATGSRSLCVSDAGASDMVGNLWEWVADWGDLATGCQSWDAAYGNDGSCVGGNGTGGRPGALIRGGYYSYGTYAGVFAAYSQFPSSASPDTGFRCAREL